MHNNASWIPALALFAKSTLLASGNQGVPLDRALAALGSGTQHVRGPTCTGVDPELTLIAVGVLDHSRRLACECLCDLCLQARSVHVGDADSQWLLGQARARNLPLVLMSATGGAGEVMKGIELGAVDYLEKPVSLPKLRNIWQHVVRKVGAPILILLPQRTFCFIAPGGLTFRLPSVWNQASRSVQKPHVTSSSVMHHALSQCMSSFMLSSKSKVC